MEYCERLVQLGSYEDCVPIFTQFVSISELIKRPIWCYCKHVLTCVNRQQWKLKDFKNLALSLNYEGVSSRGGVVPKVTCCSPNM